jgi:hypothetical protein
MAAFMAASPAPAAGHRPSGMANSRLYKIAPPIFWCSQSFGAVMQEKQARVPALG